MKLLKSLGLSMAVLGAISSAALAANFAKEQVLKVGNGTEPRELDPGRATGSPEGKILDNLFEGLVNLDNNTLEVTPGVAESWSISKDGLTYTFNIRKNAKWSDGKKLTAHDFVYSWARALSPALASEYAYQLHYIKNGAEFTSGKVKDVKKLGVKAKDDHTLVVTLNNPTAFFLKLTAFRTLYPVPKHVIEKHKDAEWTKEGNMVSNGPFKLTEWKINKHVIAVKNPNYWDVKNVVLDRVEFFPIEKVETEENAFFSNQIHMTNEVPTVKIPLYKRRAAKNPSAYHPFRSPLFLGTYYYRFNTTKKPFNDPRVRRALAMTIDRTLITERVSRAGEQPAVSFTPPGTGGYTYKGAKLNATVTPEVVAKAKALLKEAGYADISKFPKADILYNTSENHKKIAVAIQQMWKKNLGIQVGLFNQEWKVYLNNQKSMNYEISRAGWIGDYADPNTFLDMWVTDGGNNQTGWSNKTYDSLIAEAAKETEDAKRYEIFEKAESILMEELPVLPIYTYTNKKLISERVIIKDGKGGWKPWEGNIQDRINFKNYALAK